MAATDFLTQQQLQEMMNQRFGAPQGTATESPLSFQYEYPETLSPYLNLSGSANAPRGQRGIPKYGLSTHQTHGVDPAFGMLTTEESFDEDMLRRYPPQQEYDWMEEIPRLQQDDFYKHFKGQIQENIPDPSRFNFEPSQGNVTGIRAADAVKNINTVTGERTGPKYRMPELTAQGDYDVRGRKVPETGGEKQGWSFPNFGMSGIIGAIADKFKDSPQEKFNRSYFPTAERGGSQRVNINPAENVFGNKNVSYGFGPGLEVGAQGRIDTLQKTIDTLSDKWSQLEEDNPAAFAAKLARLKAKRDLFIGQRNRYMAGFKDERRGKAPIDEVPTPSRGWKPDPGRDYTGPELSQIGREYYTGPGMAFEAKPSGTFTTPGGKIGYSGGRATGGLIRRGYSDGGKVGILSVL
jgi:hypothetical protein